MTFTGTLLLGAHVVLFTAKRAARFWRKVHKEGPTLTTCAGLGPCWEWTAAKNNKGYGQVGIENKMFSAHRVSYALRNGGIPKESFEHEFCVLHRCDNPGCVNPDHLFLGTAADNANDCKTKGRVRVGETHHHHLNPAGVARGSAAGCNKLTEAQVLEIRRLYDVEKMKQAKIATIFHVDHRLISAIVTRRTWRWLQEAAAT